MTSLGQSLKKLREEQAAKEKTQSLLQNELAAIARERITALVVNRINSIKSTIQAHLSAGKEVPEIVIGKSDLDAEFCYAVEMSSWPQNGPNSLTPFYDEFQKLIQWGTDNELQISFVYCHDGMGIRSWFAISVEPL